MSLGVVRFVEVTGTSADMSANVNLHPLPIVSLANSDVRPFNSHVSAQDIVVNVLHDSLTNSPDLWDIESFLVDVLVSIPENEAITQYKFFRARHHCLDFCFRPLVTFLVFGVQEFHKFLCCRVACLCFPYCSTVDAVTCCC